MQRKRVLPLAALLLCAPALAGTVPAAAAAAVAPPEAGPAPVPAGPLRILLTNDDGYNAPGIRIAFDRLTAAGYDVTMVAPRTHPRDAG
ncbi:5'/3'-nucleotidase SurE, partial [Streptomyces sp. NPDC059411]|uniref:5'/3'-nucleotidase SurE n=1 Tax=Streptomyces sp. NPDC059411 TaxID=3346825 RepID=UPI0036D1CC10